MSTISSSASSNTTTLILAKFSSEILD
nr:hypothetical protein [Candidatus Anoxychlamydiales bacterium]